MHLAALEGRGGTFVLHRQLLGRVNLVFSSQGRCWCATAKTPLHFSTVVVSAVLRQTGLGVSSEDIRLYFQQHILLEEHRLCFDEQKHAMLAPLWKTFPQKMPTVPSTWTPLWVIFSWVWFYFQINRSWEPLLPSHKPNLFSDYLGLICLGVGVGCEGVCWQLQVLIPEESQGTENEMSTTASAGEQLEKPLGTWEGRDDWLNRAVLGKTGFLVVAMLTAFSSPEMHCFCTDSFCFFRIACPKWDSLLLPSRWLSCLMSNLFIQMGLKFVFGAHHPEDNMTPTAKWGHSYIECWRWCIVFPGIASKCMHT